VGSLNKVSSRLAAVTEGSGNCGNLTLSLDGAGMGTRSANFTGAAKLAERGWGMPGVYIASGSVRGR